MTWDQVGKLESALGVHDMVSIGDGQQMVLFPAKQEKLLESLMAQVCFYLKIITNRVDRTSTVTCFDQDIATHGDSRQIHSTRSITCVLSAFHPPSIYAELY